MPQWRPITGSGGHGGAQTAEVRRRTGTARCRTARPAALDRVLGGALNPATGGISGTVIGMADARGRVLGLGRDAVQGIGARLGRAHSRAERTDVLRAAHPVVVVVAFFEAMQELDLPFGLDEVDLTRAEHLALARADSTAPVPAPRVSDLVAADLPSPAPHTSSEAVAAALLGRYEEYAGGFLAFVEGLAVRECVDLSGRREARRLLIEVLPRAAQARDGRGAESGDLYGRRVFRGGSGSGSAPAPYLPVRRVSVRSLCACDQNRDHDRIAPCWEVDPPSRPRVLEELSRHCSHVSADCWLG
ncbi:NACHT N-terminal helical domain 7-containing protein [Streptomyces sp. NPDC001076]